MIQSSPTARRTETLTPDNEPHDGHAKTRRARHEITKQTKPRCTRHECQNRINYSKVDEKTGKPRVGALCESCSTAKRNALVAAANAPKPTPAEREDERLSRDAGGRPAYYVPHLAHYRDRASLSNAALAKLAGVGPRSLRLAVNSRQRMRTANVCKVAGALGVKPEALTGCVVEAA